MEKWLLLLLLGWNIVVFGVYWWDKRCAKLGRRRVSEKTLLICAFLGGGVGAFLGMKLVRHKTKHVRFYVLVPMALLLTLVLAGLVVAHYYGIIDPAGDLKRAVSGRF